MVGTTLTVFAILLAAVTSQAATWQWITPQRVHAMVKEGSGLWLVDVRSPVAFEQSHIEGAVNIPAELLTVKNLPKNKIIVLADDSLGLKNARVGAETLLKKGSEKIFILEGGIPVWQAEALPLVGTRSDSFRQVMWDDLAWARSNRVALRLFDLRDVQERSRGPVEGARELAGASLAERLKNLTAALRTASSPKGLAGKLEKPLPVVLVVPTAPLALEEVRKALQNLSGDFRYLEGAYPLWVAREKKKPLPGYGVCPTCPGGKVTR